MESRQCSRAAEAVGLAGARHARRPGGRHGATCASTRRRSRGGEAAWLRHEGPTVERPLGEMSPQAASGHHPPPAFVAMHGLHGAALGSVLLEAADPRVLDELVEDGTARTAHEHDRHNGRYGAVVDREIGAALHLHSREEHVHVDSELPAVGGETDFLARRPAPPRRDDKRASARVLDHGAHTVQIQGFIRPEGGWSGVDGPLEQSSHLVDGLPASRFDGRTHLAGPTQARPVCRDEPRQGKPESVSKAFPDSPQ